MSTLLEGTQSPMPGKPPKGANRRLFRVTPASLLSSLTKMLEFYDSTPEAYRGCVGPIVGIQLGEDVFNAALYRFFGD